MIKYRWGGVGWDNNVHVPVYTHNDDDDDHDHDHDHDLMGVQAREIVGVQASGRPLSSQPLTFCELPAYIPIRFQRSL